MNRKIIFKHCFETHNFVDLKNCNFLLKKSKNGQKLQQKKSKKLFCSKLISTFDFQGPKSKKKSAIFVLGLFTWNHPCTTVTKSWDTASHPLISL